MYTLLISALLVGAPLVAGVPLSPRAEFGLDIFARASLDERGSCNADNLLRLLRAPTNLPQAVPFCSSYLGMPASTSTVSTVTPIATASKTQTVTGTIVSSTTVTSIKTDISTATTTVVAVLTTTVTSNQAPAQKRATKGPLSQTVLASYGASRISSACACLTIPVEVVLTTLTAPTLTHTSSVKATVETTTTATQTVLTTTASTSTVITSSTTVSTVIVAPATPTAFKIFSTNAAGQKVYYERIANSVGDLITQTTDVTQAITFRLDAQNHLGFSSPAYPGATVLAYFNNQFFTNNAPTVVPFKPQPPGSTDTVYTWSYDPATGVLTQTTLAEFVFRTCMRALNPILFASVGPVNSDCPPTSLFAEGV